MNWRAICAGLIVLAGSIVCARAQIFPPAPVDAGACQHSLTTCPPGADPIFVPTALYFMSPSGSDSADGLAPTVGGGHGPWRSNNHPVNCGDVVLVAPGTYSLGQFSVNGVSGWGQVSNCPSPNKGIDGLGQIWFAIALCAGTDLTACTITGQADGAYPPAVVLMQGDDVAHTSIHNWSLQGFNILPKTGTDSCNLDHNAGCYAIQLRTVSDNCDVFFKHHHLAFINNTTNNAMQGIGTNDCGVNGNVADSFVDYVAIVGMIAQNANRFGDFAPQCSGALALSAVGNWDTSPGTHDMFLNNYGINNQVAGCVPKFDGEFLYVDSPDTHLFTQQIVFANNIGYLSTRECIAVTHHGWNTVPGALFKLYNNTCFNNAVGPGATESEFAPINMDSGCNGPAPYNVSVLNNISYQDHAQAATSNAPFLYAFGSCGAHTGTIIVGGTGSENIFKSTIGAPPPPCPSGGGTAPPPTYADANCNVIWNNSPVPATLTTNFFVNPVFANTADLLANWTGVPNCAGFENTTQCMGWNAKTLTLTPLSVISDLIASCAQCGGKGFQLPSTNCAPNADYPVWLKGINYLHALDGFVANSRIVERSGLTTKPCNM